MNRLKVGGRGRENAREAVPLWREAAAPTRVAAVVPRLAVAVLTIVMLSGTPAVALETPAVAGTTVIEADTSAMARVTVPQEARLRLVQGDNPDVAIDGGERLGGLYLRRLASPLNDPQFVVAWQDEPCSVALCDERIIGTSLPRTSDGGSLLLPAGEYELALIVDRGPLRVTLRLAGLEGAATIAPAETVDATIASATGSGSFLVNDSASQNIAIGSPYGIRIHEYTLRSAAPGGVAFEACTGGFCSRGAGTYAQGDVQDGPYGVSFGGPASYVHAVRASGALAAPWNSRLTTAAVTFSSATVTGQVTSSS